MSETDVVDVDLLAKRIGELPELAAASVGVQYGDRSVRTRRAPSSRLPGGVDLGAIDLERGRQQPRQLSRLSMCVRVVVEEMPPAVWGRTPELAVEGSESWMSESGWLLATLPWWRGDPWCVEWVTTEVDHPDTGIRAVLTRAVRALEDPTRRTCASCGVRLAAWTSASLMVAECPSCDLVAGVAPRQMVTARQAAARWGVTLRAVQQVVRRKGIAMLGHVEGAPAYDLVRLADHFERETVATGQRIV